MIDIAVRNLEKYHGANYVLKKLSFEVKSGEKVGLLGKNGAGKTTLFNILSGKLPDDGGEVMLRKGAAIGVLEQLPQYQEGFTGSDVLYSAFDRLLDIERQLEELAALLASRPDEVSLEKYGQLQREFESAGGYEIEEKVNRVTKGLNIGSDLLTRPITLMSGGEKTRLSLGKMLLANPDVILLDEPTNHLDIGAIEWLEGFLRQYKGTVIVISHDRYFLDQIAERIVELVEGQAEFYSGNYTFFAAEKEARYLRQLEKYEQEQKTIKRLEEAATRLHGWAQQADNPAMHRQAFNIEKRIERMDKTPKPRKEKALTTAFRDGDFSGNDIVVIKNLAKGYNGKKLLDGISLRVRKGERVALIGDNGCGKSTLLKIILGDLAADAGEVKLGESVRFGYLPQNVVFDNPAATVLDTVRTVVGVYESDARRILADYRFRSEDVFRQVKNLSGGEKSRLRLCLLMQKDVNFLVLDEPTNHLDTDSREWLEKALADFNGTILFVAHDRYFIAKYAMRVIELADGKITDYCGGYGYYRDAKKVIIAPPPVKTPSSRANVAPVRKSTPPDRAKLENDITELESRLANLNDAMQNCDSDYSSLGELMAEQQELKLRLEELYDKWLAQ